MANIALAGVLCLAAALRLSWVKFGLPVYLIDDEQLTLGAIEKVRQTLDHGWHYYPAFYYYVSTAFIQLFTLAYDVLHRFGLGERDGFTGWYVVAALRVMNVVYSLITVVLTYHMGKLLHSRKMGLIAAFLLALMPLHVRYSVPALLNTFFMLMGVCVVFFAVRYFVTRKLADLILCCVFAGLAIGTKYLFVAPVAPLVVKFVVDREQGARFFNRQLVGMLAVVGGCAVASTPFSVVHLVDVFVHDVSLYAKGQPWNPGSLAIFPHTKGLFNSGLTPAFFTAMCLGVAFWFWRDWRTALVLFTMPILWYLICGMFRIAASYNFLLITSPCALAAAYFICRLPGALLQAPILVLIAFRPLSADVSYVHTMRKPDIRYKAANWINANLPKGSRIAREDYETPYFDEDLFTPKSYPAAHFAFMTPDEVREKGYDYILVDLSLHNFYWHDSVSSRQRLTTLRSHFEQFDTAAIFEPDSHWRGHRIAVLRVTPAADDVKEELLHSEKPPLNH